MKDLLMVLEGIRADEAETLDRLCVWFEQGMISDRAMLAEHLGRVNMISEIVRMAGGEPNEES